MERMKSVPVQTMLAGAVVTSLVTGCSALTRQSASTCSVDDEKRPATVVTEPEVAEVSEEASNLLVDVTSTRDEPVRVTVRFDDKLALDVELPGTPSVCAHQPVYRYAYQLPRGRARVTVSTDGGQRGETTPTVGGGKRWVVVQVQDGFPLEVDTWNTQPQWG